MRTTVRTYTGKDIDLLCPDLAQISIDDIAHHLSLINRYNGACPYPYSVAQHSLYVAAILPPELKKWGLLHDAAEAYLGDLVSPAKRIEELAAFKALEHRIQNAICERFGLDPHIDYSPIQHADKSVQAVEMAYLNKWPDLVDIDSLPAQAAIEIKQKPWTAVRTEFMAMFTLLDTVGEAA